MYLQGTHGALGALFRLASALAAAAAVLVLDDVVDLCDLARAQEARKPGPQQIRTCTRIRERLQTLEEGPHRLLSATVASQLLTGHAALASGVVTVVSPTTLTLGRSIAQQYGMPSYGPRHAAHLLGLPRVGSED